MAARRRDHGGSGASDELHSGLEYCFGPCVTCQELEAATLVLVMLATLEIPHSLQPSEGALNEGSVFLLNHLTLPQSAFRHIEDVLPDLFDRESRCARRPFAALVNNCFRARSVFHSYREKEQKHLAAGRKRGQLDACMARVNEVSARLASSVEEKPAMTAEVFNCSKTTEAYRAKKAAITTDYQQLEATLCAYSEAVERAKMELRDVAEAVREAQASVCGDRASWKEKAAAQAENLATLEKERDQSTVLALEKKVCLSPAIKEALIQATLDDVGRLKARVAEMEARAQAKVAAEERLQRLREHCALRNKVKVGSEELARLAPKVGGPRDIDAGPQKRERRNSDIRKRCEEMEAAYKAASCSAELSELETAIAATEEEICATDQLA